VNGRPAKASVQVKPGDVIEIAFGNKTVKAEVLSVKESIRKEDAENMYRYL
jgi:ribosomal 50S subunit-recycling heat shock protein